VTTTFTPGRKPVPLIESRRLPSPAGVLANAAVGTILTVAGELVAVHE
jgi:hypothetical protein